MEPLSDSRFDPNYPVQVLLDVAHEHSVDLLLRKLVFRAVERPDIACTQVWLIQKGDRCQTCPHRALCQDQTRCLHLVAGRGISLFGCGQAAPAFDDSSARNPLGVGFLGKTALASHQNSLADPHLHAEETPGFDWIEREGIRKINATPVTYKGEILGVIISFTRADLPAEARPWGRIFADHIGAAIANARAFEEIQRLKAQLELQNAYLQEEVVVAKAFGDLVGQSYALRQVVHQIDLVAPTEASVLILGETGTGKELVAHEIHRRSRRKDGPLVRVNCAAIPKHLFESEFFGHLKGAFTGALKDRPGRFQTAEHGTLFLDEIGEVPLEIQSKLLRVLQEKLYEPVGDDRSRAADIRIIAATNRDLKKAVAAGTFREDLYYRLNVFPIHVAPLRERRDDIPLLAAHFVDLSARELKCPKPRLTRAALAALQNYDWPGNIRELRNLIERAVILARGGPLHIDLPNTSTLSTSAPQTLRPEMPSSGTLTSASFLTEPEMRRFERENLLAALNAAGWKVKGPGGAAEMLGLKPTTLLSRIQKLRLQRP